MADVNRQNSTPASVVAEQLGLSARQFKLYLAQNVATARHRAGLTQLQLAQAAELSRATVHLVEAGICDPRLSTIARLAEALHVNALELLTKDLRARRQIDDPRGTDQPEADQQGGIPDAGIPETTTFDSPSLGST